MNKIGFHLSYDAAKKQKEIFINYCYDQSIKTSNSTVWYTIRIQGSYNRRHDACTRTILASKGIL